MKSPKASTAGRAFPTAATVSIALLIAAAWYSLRDTRPADAGPPPQSDTAARQSGQVRIPHNRANAAGDWLDPEAETLQGTRAVRFDLQSLPAPDEWKRDDVMKFPLPEGGEVVVKVNLVQTESDGTVRIGGAVTSGDGGSFFLGSSKEDFGGMILLPAAGLAYVIDRESEGSTVIREMPLSQVVCEKMPIPDAPPKSDGPSPAPLPEEAPPILSSRPGATAVLYLDFDGETVADPAWNNGNTIVAAPALMTNAEISETWNRVKEDFLPFNIDVTTNPQRYSTAPVGRRMRVIITPTNTARPGAGGVAYVNSFSSSLFSTTIPCWVFNQGIIGSSEAISHEIGHTLGLLHDGRPGQEYYRGHGSGAVGWAPIMGVGYDQPLVQWSRGEYADANNQEDDLALIARAQNGFGYVSDEAGNTRGTAAALTVAGGVVNQTGIITQASDSDFYAFTVAQSSNVAINANPADISPNLDILLELQNSSGNVLASANPDSALNAGFSLNVAAGTYYVKVSGTGRGNVLGDGYSSYGSMGHYSLGGSIVTAGIPVISSMATADGSTNNPFAYQIVASNAPTSYAVTGTLPTGVTLNSSTGLISGTPGNAGVFAVTLRAINASGTGTAPLTLTIVASQTFTNSAAISIPLTGQATPYPSTISVNGFSGVTSKIVVRLFGLSHTFPGDLDILLVGPGGQTAVLLSDVGGSTPVSGITLAFDDAAASNAESPLVSGTFRPTNVGSNDSFGTAAPPSPYGGVLSEFSQINPNGLWQLFVIDDASGDQGVISGGWSLSLITDSSVPVLAVQPAVRNIEIWDSNHSFSVTTNGNWNWSSSASWVMSVEPANQTGSGNFDYTVAANTGPDSRTAVITLTSGALTSTHTIHQAAGSPEDFADVLVMDLPDGSQSVWLADGNSLDEAELVTPTGLQGDAFDSVGSLDVKTVSGFGTVNSSNLWENHGINPQAGTFNATFSTTPSSDSVDTVLGFSNGPADWWDDLAAYVRFNPQGRIDARNGSNFSAEAILNYNAGVSYLVEMQINVVTKRFRATVTPIGGTPVVIANNYAFRTEQAAVTKLSHFACLTWTGGTQTVSGLVVPSLGTVTATNVWGNHGVPSQRKSLVASFLTTPGGNAVDTTIGFSDAAADFWDDMAAYVRFNPQGRIDARNGSGFAAAAVFNYNSGVTYRIDMEIDVENKHYSASVTAAGGSPVVIANNYAFRTEQSAITELSNFAYLTWTGGTQTVSGLVVSDVGSLTATNIWGNHELAPQNGIFTASFIAIPNAGAIDGVLGFSNGEADFWDDLAAYVRFNDQGKVDARNGTYFSADADLTYTAGVSYLVSMELNVPLKRYSVTVTPAGEAPRVIAYSHEFRPEQDSIASLSNFAYLTWTGGFLTVRDFALTGTKSELPALSSANINGPLSATTSAGQTRVTKEIHLVAGIHATDEVITVENLSAGQRLITVLLSDNYGSDSATTVHASSSGDTVVGPDDHWFVSNDRIDSSAISGDPTLMVSWVYSPNFSAPALREIPGGGSDQLQLSFAATLGAGQQATITVRRQLFENAVEAITEGQPVESGTADLANLTLSSGSLMPAFQPSVTDYTAQAPNALSALTVTPTLSQAGSTVRVNGTVVSSGSPSPSISLNVGGNLITTVVTAPNGTTTKTYTVNVNRSPSTNADLGSLTLSSGNLAPAFASATINYTAAVSNSTSSVTVTPTTAQGSATVTVDGIPVVSGVPSGPIALAVGINTITTVVTAQDGIAKKTYTIAVTRDASSNADLAGIALSTGTLTPSFASATTSYTASVSNTITSLTISPTVAQANATVRVNGTLVPSGTPSGSISLNVGSNSITTLVTAQDGTTTKTYTVNVTRAPSPNADLAGLALSSGTLTPSFASATTSYTASVSNTTTTLTLTPTVAQANATVRVNGTLIPSGTASGSMSLNVGNNTITTVVTAQDATTTKTYTITVSRAPSGNADLVGLALSAGTLTPAFSVGTISYTASVPNTNSSLTVTPTVAQANATVRVNGILVPSGTPSAPISLNFGSNTITTLVTAQNGSTTRTYTITVTRALSDLQAWRQTWFGTFEDLGNAADFFDHDRDGLVNLVEYALGLNPTSGSSCQLPPGQRVGGNFVVDFSVPESVSGIQFGAFWSASLASGGWQPVSDTGIGNRHTFSVPVAENSPIFIRLTVTRNP